MNNKMIGGVLAILGIIAGVVGYALWHTSAGLLTSKRMDAAVGLGIVLLIVGIVMLVMPAQSSGTPR